MSQSMSSLSLFLLSSRGRRRGGSRPAAPPEGGGMTIPNNYIIRIYRRDRSDPEKIYGILEDIESGLKHRFTSFANLKKILAAAEARHPR